MSAYKTPNDSIYLTNYTLVLIVVIKEFTLIHTKEIYSLTDSLIIISYCQNSVNELSLCSLNIHKVQDIFIPKIA